MARTRYMTRTIEKGRTKAQEYINIFTEIVEKAQNGVINGGEPLRQATIKHVLNKLTVWKQILDNEPMPEDMVDKLNDSSQDMFDTYLEYFGQKDIRELSENSKAVFQRYKELITDYNNGVNILAIIGRKA